MINAVEVLTAWDKTLETQDFSHLRKYLSDDFQFENTQGEINNLEPVSYTHLTLPTNREV